MNNTELRYVEVKIENNNVFLISEHRYKKDVPPGATVFTRIGLYKFKKAHPGLKFTFDVPEVKDNRGINTFNRGRLRMAPEDRRVKFQGNIMLPRWMTVELKAMSKKLNLSAGRIVEAALVQMYGFRKRG